VKAETSSLVGQISFKKTGFPYAFLPIGSFSKSISTVPANA
jgi:hypothetical protein